MNDVMKNSVHSRHRILVIKLGALGDFVLALGPCAAIRRHHPYAHITLLTTVPCVDLAAASGYFDEIWDDGRIPWWRPAAWVALLNRVGRSSFERVYDLQTSERSGWYFKCFGRKLEWSGIAKGCSHCHDNPDRDSMHTLERQAEQLAITGVVNIPAPDLSWAKAEIKRFCVTTPFVLLVPGGAPHRLGKRWPALNYAALASALVETGRRPVLVGAKAEHQTARQIMEKCDATIDLTGQTTLLEVAALARSAVAAVGNDTGPMHISAAVGCPSVVLFSSESDPALTAPRGENVTILRRDSLADLPVGNVLSALA